VTLTVDKERFDLGDKIEVSWSIESEDRLSSGSDWIALYEKGEQNPKNYLTYEWSGKSQAKQGKVIFATPSIYGEYQFRYLAKRSYTELALSSPVSIGPIFNLNAHLKPNEQEDNQSSPKTIQVFCQQVSGASYPNAWIGLFEPNKGNKEYLTYDWLSSAKSNNLEFAVPKTGEWQLRLFLTRPGFFGSVLDYQKCSVFLGGENQLELSRREKEVVIKYRIETLDPYAESAWIGLFFASETNHRQWRRYKYVYSGGVGEITFKTPQTAGSYEARLLTRNSPDTPLCISKERITIPWKKI